ncbi:MAG: proline--tRNA ligase, partial [Flavobacteriales bacterium]|nr:proline--tRNA ligase [Flavobacteriales bacterium]
VEHLLNKIQQNLYQKALDFRDENTHHAANWEEFKNIIEEKGGFIHAHWDGTEETADKIKEETKATIRCIPLDDDKEEGLCVYSGKPSARRVIFARAY